MTTRRYALRDDQWERIKDLLPGREGTVGVTAQDNRLFVEAVLCRPECRDALAQPATAVWRFPGRAYALESVVENGGIGAGIPALSRGCG